MVSNSDAAMSDDNERTEKAIRDDWEGGASYEG